MMEINIERKFLKKKRDVKSRFSYESFFSSQVIIVFSLFAKKLVTKGKEGAKPT